MSTIISKPTPDGRYFVRGAFGGIVEYRITKWGNFFVRSFNLA